MRRKVNTWTNIDWITVLIYVLLVIMGWINIYAAVYNDEHQSILDISQRYGKQLIWIFAAFFLATTIILIDAEFFSFFSYLIYIITIVLLLSVLVFGKEVNGARSWFEVGGLRIQPAEFAKFATLLALSKYISSYNIKIQKITTLFIIGVLLVFPAILILAQNDTGSALVYASFIFVLYREGLSGSILVLGFLLIVMFVLALIISKMAILFTLIILGFIIFWILRQKTKELLISLGIFVGSTSLLYIAGWLFYPKLDLYYSMILSLGGSSIYYIFYAFKKKLSYVISMLLIIISSVAFTYTVDYLFYNVLEDHHRDRINDLLGIESDPLGAGYNVNQSKIAIGSGGFWGKGFLNGTQTKYDFVPEQSTDFIFCTVGEEWGFVGSSIVIILFILLILRLILLAERQKDTFARIFGYGVVSIFFFHVAINVGMTIGLAPVIGIPLPFFSYGGSSLWAFTILLFIFLRLDVNRLEMLR